MKSKIVFIGAGNLATHLSKQFHALGHNIIQVYSRTEESARELSEAVNATYTTSITKIEDSADFYIFSVKDSVLESLIQNMPHSKGLWIHTAGSISMDVFEGKVNDYGVLYPLQTFTKSRDIKWSDIPLLIEGSTVNTHVLIEKLARQISSKIHSLSSDKRIYVHASAVFACNFVNHMYSLAKDLVDRSELPFNVLLPLIDETCKKAHKLSPRAAQTGPAIRFDENVIKKHLDVLGDNIITKEIYEMLSKSIYNSFKEKD